MKKKSTFLGPPLRHDWRCTFYVGEELLVSGRDIVQATAARCTLHLNSAMMLFDHLACNRQAQSDAAEQMIANTIHVEKAIVDMRKRFGRDADTLFLNDDPDLAGLGVDFNQNISTIRAELNGVIQDSSDGAFKAFSIPFNGRYSRRDDQFDAHLVLFSVLALLFNRCCNQRAQVNQLEFWQDEIHFLQK